MKRKGQLSRNMIILILILTFIVITLIVFMNIKEKILG